MVVGRGWLAARLATVTDMLQNLAFQEARGHHHDPVSFSINSKPKYPKHKSIKSPGSRDNVDATGMAPSHDHFHRQMRNHFHGWNPFPWTLHPRDRMNSTLR